MTAKLINHCGDIGLLVMRVGLGVMFAVGHGWDKISSPDKWEGLGSAIGALGVPVFLPKVFGFLAAFAEFGGAILIALGLVYRPATFLLFFTMVVASAMHLSKGDAFFGGASRPIELGFILLGMLIVGPGRLALDTLWMPYCPFRKMCKRS